MQVSLHETVWADILWLFKPVVAAAPVRVAALVDNGAFSSSRKMGTKTKVLHVYICSLYKPSNHLLCLWILYPYYKLAALQKCDRTAHFKCFTLFGGSEISSVFNSVSCSRLRNFTVVTESYLAFYTRHQSRRFALSRTLCRK